MIGNSEATLAGLDADSVPMDDLLVKCTPAHQKVEVPYSILGATKYAGSNISEYDQFWIRKGSGGLHNLPQLPFAIKSYAFVMPLDRPPARGLNHKRKPTGPILLLSKILTTWKLGGGQATRLLGMDPSDESYVAEVLAGRKSLKGRDANDRLAYLIQIRMALFAWFRDEEVENDWLREAQVALDGQVPMDLLLEGSMENLLLVKEYVEAATGW